MLRRMSRPSTGIDADSAKLQLLLDRPLGDEAGAEAGLDGGDDGNDGVEVHGDAEVAEGGGRRGAAPARRRGAILSRARAS